MAYPYITQADLEARVSANVVRRILDDDNNGTADAAPLTRIIADASAKVAGYLRGVYDLTAVAAAPPQEVLRLTLDVAHAYLAMRHPEWFRGDGHKMLETADRELKALRRGDTRLDVVGSPEPTIVVGGSVEQGDPDAFVQDTYRPDFGFGFGDY